MTDRAASSNALAPPGISSALTRIFPDISWSTNSPTAPPSTKWPPATYHHLLGISPSGLAGVVLSNHSQYLRTLKNFKASHNLYIGVNPTINYRAVRPSACDIPFVTAILVDIDPSPSSPSSPSGLIEPDICDMVHLVEWFEAVVGLPHTTTHLSLFSGRGIQILYPVEGSPLLDAPLRAGWQAAVASFLHTLGRAKLPVPGRIDPATSDLPRVRRALGSINQKTGRTAYAISLIDAGKCIQFNDFLEFWTPKNRPESIVPSAHPSKWWKNFRVMPVTARKFLTEEVPEGERNHGAFVAASALLDAGADAHTTRTVLEKANGCQGKPLDLHELSRIIANALKRKGR